jgi:hypothetical protein
MKNRRKVVGRNIYSGWNGFVFFFHFSDGSHVMLEHPYNMKRIERLTKRWVEHR